MPVITIEIPGSSSLDFKLHQSSSILIEISGDIHDPEAVYASFQFEGVKHPKLPEAFGSTVFCVNSQNISVVIRTIYSLTSKIEDKEVW